MLRVSACQSNFPLTSACSSELSSLRSFAVNIASGVSVPVDLTSCLPFGVGCYLDVAVGACIAKAVPYRAACVPRDRLRRSHGVLRDDRGRGHSARQPVKQPRRMIHSAYVTSATPPLPPFHLPFSLRTSLSPARRALTSALAGLVHTPSFLTGAFQTASFTEWVCFAGVQSGALRGRHRISCGRGKHDARVQQIAHLLLAAPPKADEQIRICIRCDHFDLCSLVWALLSPLSSSVAHGFALVVASSSRVAGWFVPRLTGTPAPLRLNLSARAHKLMARDSIGWMEHSHRVDRASSPMSQSQSGPGGGVGTLFSTALKSICWS